MYHIIVNPVSRTGLGLQIWKKHVEPMLHEQQVTYRSYFSTEHGDVARIVSEILASSKERPITIILLGGDGTVNEALQGMDDTSDIILGYIPTGSSNDLARDIGIPTVPEEALDLILHAGTPKPLDLGCVTYDDGATRRFIVSSGVGFDAAVCEEALHSKMKTFLNKMHLGKLTYLGIALKQLFAAKAVSCKLTLDDGEPIDIHKILFVACMLHRYEGGGLMFCPDADATDGILDLCTVGNLSKGFILMALPTAFKGKHYRFKGIEPYRARRIHIETSAPLWVHTDGEVTRKSSSFTVTCSRHAIQMLRK